MRCVDGFVSLRLRLTLFLRDLDVFGEAHGFYAPSPRPHKIFFNRPSEETTPFVRPNALFMKSNTLQRRVPSLTQPLLP